MNLHFGGRRKLYWIWLAEHRERERQSIGFEKSFITFFVFLNYADVENSGSLRVFSYIYIINIFKNMNLIEKIKKMN